MFNPTVRTNYNLSKIMGHGIERLDPYFERLGFSIGGPHYEVHSVHSREMLVRHSEDQTQYLYCSIGQYVFLHFQLTSNNYPSKA